MPPFEWVRFLDSLGIEWVSRGPNVAHGHINIQCPFCGLRDPSHHFGIRLEDGAWGCFRDPTHRGKSVIKLIATLKGCSWEDAKELLEEGIFPDARSFSDLREKLDGLGKGRIFVPVPASWPEEARTFKRDPRGIEKRFHRYLKSRGYFVPYWVAERYDLRFCLTGRWAHRILFPLKDAAGALFGWTGRSIVGSATARYKTYPEDETAKHFFYNLDQVAGGGITLAIVEGPTDALKVDEFGRSCGLRAVGQLGLTTSPARIAALRALLPRYRHIVLLMDKEARSAAMRLAGSYALLGPKLFVGHLPPGVGDPGEMNPRQIRQFAKGITGLRSP